MRRLALERMLLLQYAVAITDNAGSIMEHLTPHKMIAPIRAMVAAHDRL